MTDAIISFICVIVGLLLLRSLGGQGLNIKFKLAPLSTPKGKKDHFVVWAALSIMALGIVRYFVRQNGANVVPQFFVPFILGASVVLLSRLKNKSRR